jgi:hypothetical protein
MCILSACVRLYASCSRHPPIVAGEGRRTGTRADRRVLRFLHLGSLGRATPRPPCPEVKAQPSRKRLSAQWSWLEACKYKLTQYEQLNVLCVRTAQKYTSSSVYSLQYVLTRLRVTVQSHETASPRELSNSEAGDVRDHQCMNTYTEQQKRAISNSIVRACYRVIHLYITT